MFAHCEKLSGPFMPPAKPKSKATPVVTAPSGEPAGSPSSALVPANTEDTLAVSEEAPQTPRYRPRAKTKAAAFVATLLASASMATSMSALTKIVKYNETSAMHVDPKFHAVYCSLHDPYTPDQNSCMDFRDTPERRSIPRFRSIF